MVRLCPEASCGERDLGQKRAEGRAQHVRPWSNAELVQRLPWRRLLGVKRTCCVLIASYSESDPYQTSNLINARVV